MAWTSNAAPVSISIIFSLTTPLWQRTRGPVHAHHITCARKAFTMESFRAALQAYRSIQLENVRVPAHFNESVQEFV